MKKILIIFCWLICSTRLSQAQQTISVADELSEAYLHKLVDAAMANYPGRKVFDARKEGAEFAVKRARLSYFDIFSFSYLFVPGIQPTVNPLLQTSYQFGFFANIGSLVQKPAFIKQNKAEVETIGYEKQVFELNLESEVRQRYYVYMQKRALLRVVAQSLLDLESMQKSVRHRFEKGEETLENYNKALLAYSNQLQTKVTTEGEIMIAKSLLEEMIGQKLEEIK